MDPKALHATIVELEGHSSWVRKLALDLLHDRAAADDVVQETWIAALRRPPSGALKPWLAAVARNLALRWNRDRANAGERERAVARREALPASADVAERLESERRLIAALAALEEPLRATLIARYLDGRSSAEIARRDGVAAATVRWRVQRGLARLREQLEVEGERSGKRLEALLAQLLPEDCEVVAPTLSLSIPTALTGVATMQATKIAVGAALALIAGVGWWLWTDSRPAAHEPQPARPIAIDVASLPAAAQEPLYEAAREPAPEVAARTPGASEPAAVREAASSPAATLATIEARIVDDRGAPIERASISAISRDDSAVESGADGRVVLECAPPEPGSTTWTEAVALGARDKATRFLAVDLALGKRVQIGDVELGVGAAIEGYVLLQDGRPCAGAQVTVTDPSLIGDLADAQRVGPVAWPGAPRARADARGFFRVEGVEPRVVVVWAGHADMRFARTAPIELAPLEQRTGVELRLEPIDAQERIAGRVLAPSGEPVPNARIAWIVREQRSSHRGDKTADAEGRFELRLVCREPHDLIAFDPTDRWAPVSVVGAAPGTLDLELRFHETRWIDLEAVDPRGEPVEAFAWRVTSGDGEDELAREARAPRARGVARVRVPGGPFRAEIDALGFDLATAGPFVGESAPERARFVLVPLPGVRGRVVADGRPVAGAAVTLHESAVGRADVDVDGHRARMFPTAIERSITDDQGRFEITLRHDGVYFLIARADGLAIGELGPRAWRGAVGERELEIALVRGGSIEGRVLVAPGRSPEGVIVVANRGDLAVRSVRADAAGTFRIDGLTPGSWLVARGDREVLGAPTSWATGYTTKPKPFVGNCEVQDGRATRFDVDLRDERACTLRGRVRVGGREAAGWLIGLWPEGNAVVNDPLPTTAADAQGRFVLTIDRPGRYALSLRPGDDQTAKLSLSAPVELAPGDLIWELDVATGRLRGTVGPSTPKDAYVSWRRADGVRGVQAIVPGAEGRFELDLVPAGELAIGAFDPSATDGDAWVTCMRVELAENETREVELP